MIVAACGSLEDDVICAGGGDVFDRWDGTFDGLHLLMGYGSVTNDNKDEGNRIVQYARGGSTLVDAWFRTGREIQPSTNDWGAPFGPTVWVEVMYVTRGLASAANDHLWGHGSVAPDPTSPDGLSQCGRRADEASDNSPQIGKCSRRDSRYGYHFSKTLGASLDNFSGKFWVNPKEVSETIRNTTL